jgi:hypothetical protein
LSLSKSGSLLIISIVTWKSVISQYVTYQQILINSFNVSMHCTNTFKLLALVAASIRLRSRYYLHVYIIATCSGKLINTLSSKAIALCTTHLILGSTCTLQPHNCRILGLTFRLHWCVHMTLVHSEHWALFQKYHFEWCTLPCETQNLNTYQHLVILLKIKKKMPCMMLHHTRTQTIPLVCA